MQVRAVNKAYQIAKRYYYLTALCHRFMTNRYFIFF
jgi:hypothetical protein